MQCRVSKPDKHALFDLPRVPDYSLKLLLRLKFPHFVQSLFGNALRSCCPMPDLLQCLPCDP